MLAGILDTGTDARHGGLDQAETGGDIAVRLAPLSRQARAYATIRNRRSRGQRQALWAEVFLATSRRGYSDSEGEPTISSRVNSPSRTTAVKVSFAVDTW